MSRAVGLLGGTFDPPHVGHLVVAEQARDRLGLDEVRLLVAGDPWMKADESPAAVRVELAGLSVAGNPGLAVDDRETLRSGPTYTVDTLRQLREEDPDLEPVFLLGADAAARLPQWHGAEEALALARFVAVHRPGHDVAGLPVDVEVLDVPAIGVSSTAVREAVAGGRSVRYLVPEPVRRRVHELGLYVDERPPRR